MSHQCYVCGNVVSYDRLLYECMCFNDTPIKYRGICNIHEPIPNRSEWKENPDHNHHLKKIYKPTEQEKQFWDKVEQALPKWQSFIVRNINNKRMMEFSRNVDPIDMTEEEYNKIIQNNPKHFTKSFIIEMPDFLKN